MPNQRAPRRGWLARSRTPKRRWVQRCLSGMLRVHRLATAVLYRIWLSRQLRLRIPRCLKSTVLTRPIQPATARRVTGVIRPICPCWLLMPKVALIETGSVAEFGSRWSRGHSRQTGRQRSVLGHRNQANRSATVVPCVVVKVTLVGVWVASPFRPVCKRDARAHRVTLVK